MPASGTATHVMRRTSGRCRRCRGRARSAGSRATVAAPPRAGPRRARSPRRRRRSCRRGGGDDAGCSGRRRPCRPRAARARTPRAGAARPCGRSWRGRAADDAACARCSCATVKLPSHASTSCTIARRCVVVREPVGSEISVIGRSLHENESHSHLGRMEAARRTPRYAHGTRMQARLLALFVLGAASAAIGAGVATTAQSPVATASAYAIAIVVPGQPGSSAGACRRRARRWPPWRTPSRTRPTASIARTGALSTSVASRTGGTPVAHAVTDVLTGSLFNGEITWESVAGRAKSTAASSDADGSGVQGLVVLGQPVAPVPNQRVALADWGSSRSSRRSRRAPMPTRRMRASP